MYFLSPRRIIPALLAAGLAVAMLTPVDVPQSVPSGTDKLLHLAAFGLLVLPAAPSQRVPLGLLFVGLFVGAAPSVGRSSSFSPTLVAVRMSTTGWRIWLAPH